MGIAIIGIMHLSKASDRPPLYRASGSMAFVAASRAAYVVVKYPGDGERRVLAPIKFNIEREPAALGYRIAGSPAVVQWEREPLEDFNVDAAIAKLADGNDESGERREGPKVGAALEFLRALLREGPQPTVMVRDAARAAGIRDKTPERALTQAKAAGWLTLVPRPGGGYFYAMPDTTASRSSSGVGVPPSPPIGRKGVW